MRQLVIALLLCPCTLAAQTMYKCKSESGTSVYQQTQCETEDSTVESRYIAREQDSAPGPHVQQDGGWPVDPPVRTRASRSYGSAFAQGDQDARSEVYLYSCNDGRRTWTQAKPCTAMIRYTEIENTIGPNGIQRGHVVQRIRPAEQQALTRQGVCAGTQSSGSKGIDSYERNKLKSLGQC